MDNRFGEMEVFARAVATGSFSAAARQLNMTPSAISRLVSRLEDRLQVRLLVRSTRSLTPTPEGEIYLAEARSLLDKLTDMEARITDGAQAAVRGPLRVSSTVGFGATVIMPLVPEFLKLYPEVELDITLNDSIIDLWQERTDLAIRSGALKDSALKARPITLMRRLVVVSPGYLEKHGTPERPEDLRGHNCLRYNFQPSEWEFADPETGQTLRQVVSGNFLGSDGTILRRICIEDGGLMKTGEHTVADDLATGRLVEVLAPWSPREPEKIHAVFPGHPHLAARIRAFIDFLAAKV